MPAAKYAIEKALKEGISCIGLHTNLTVGKPLIENKNLTDEKGIFLYGRKQNDNPKLVYQEIYNEVKAQVEKVKEYSQGKLSIDHMCVHHYIFENELIWRVVCDIAKEYKIPVRLEDTTLIWDFTIENVNIDKIKEIINRYKNDDESIYELMTHPGYIDEETKNITSYLERDKELKILKQAKEIGLFENIDLLNFSKIKK